MALRLQIPSSPVLRVLLTMPGSVLELFSFAARSGIGGYATGQVSVLAAEHSINLLNENLSVQDQAVVAF